MNSKIRSVLFACLGLLFGMAVMWVFNSFYPKKNEDSKNKTEKNHTIDKKPTQSANDIFILTNDKTVVAYVKKNHTLPDYYITKNEAKKLGWKPESGNLCEVLPKKAIGGDHFGDREKRLPENSNYYEADVNYNCGTRGTDRIIFSTDGTVYLTKDHYKTFQKQ
ncbi:ribonuclease N [Chryseobacterium sp. Leaf180]|uniref:ribonuclease domain-containing protein n=1 Tax=Chryseobacterium sp. Leaf180 TaxID=1736289 RepID=UPI0006F7AF32|nr:ribonuclease domain-containing protein [Chryseobacterium sp. Leaf180]KQR92484.1 ribonuclease N [Chryseobacterium sp. Leaf180]